FARENGIPFFGICLGMQLAVIEYARNVCGLEGASSTEFEDGATHKVIDLMPEQRGLKDKGGTMRLGAWPCTLKPGSFADRIYGKPELGARHGPRLEVYHDYRERLENAGLTVSGTRPDGTLVEIVELSVHPHFIACQFHPEFKSRQTQPHPPFTQFVAAAQR